MASIAAVAMPEAGEQPLVWGLLVAHAEKVSNLKLALEPSGRPEYVVADEVGDEHFRDIVI